VWKEVKKNGGVEREKKQKAADRDAKWKPIVDSHDHDMERGSTTEDVMWMLEHIDADRELVGGCFGFSHS
jgi:hypothetical protein